MKILYRVIYMFTLIVLLTACGGKPATTAPATEPATTEASMEHSHSEGQADPFELSVAQVIMDSAGFHGIATALSETQTIDPTYLSTVTSVSKVLSHTTWPADLHDQAQAFIESLASFAAALEADNVADAVTNSETVHDAQHELSHAIEHWLGDAMNMGEANTFDVSVAQKFMDSAGFHGMATALAETQSIDPSYASTVTRVHTVLSHTVFPSELNDQAQAFIETLASFSAALEADNTADAGTLSETVHDAQHELSHALEPCLVDQQQ